ncbi:hypothetical protein HZC53_01920 [Candidatus Uhrbacteria bacterium]|nr:hypothetical protein [Candidatus Uhrbacteria bacterium]
MTNTDPLQKLLVSESQAVDRQELADLLSPYLSINKETRSFDFAGKFGELQNAEKLLILFAAIKARSLVFGTDDKVTPSEIIKMDFAPVGSIKVTLKKLLESRDIKSENGKYSLPNYKLAQVVARFKKLEK